ncbi:TetR/AcrR family transcriptional regulator [Trinickia diaoshuihuensis]|uniref:TetR/AcrR family transcriptional regulator n=1 Tax=Trinickia diaoshuihuensis TaxID=2292265 RepID=UPI000E2626A5|nr:TetR/AcrR family transcriptional regulator [Trinickia diaoshuihuensis]
MVQKKKEGETTVPRRARGRPRAYDASDALARARDTFWQGGYSATTLDELGAAMGMNRPSLYGAFGDKHALYLATLERYIEVSEAAMNEVLASELPLAAALVRVYDLALALYYRSADAPTGCFLTGTAVAEAVDDEQVRTILGEGLRVFDRAFEARLVRARGSGELPANADAALLSRIASAILHSMGVRARAGDDRAQLRAMAEAAVAMICGGGMPGHEPK